MNIILASASPRRRELMATAGIPCTVMSTDADESLPEGIAPQRAVEILSRRKAEAAIAAVPADPDNIIIAADTVVYAGGRILGKPKDKDEARAMLRLYSGTAHSVFTGVTVARGGRMITDHVETLVCFRPLTEGEIEGYISSIHPYDKAGGYGIQGPAAMFVSRIEGDYFNVVGLPLCRLGEMLGEIGAL